eukprot:713567_1
MSTDKPTQSTETEPNPPPETKTEPTTQPPDSNPTEPPPTTTETNHQIPESSDNNNTNNSNTNNSNTNNSNTNNSNTNDSNTTTIAGKKRKRSKTRWGTPPRKKRWGSKQTHTSSLISNLIKISNQKQNTNLFNTAQWNENQTKIFLLKNQLQDVSTRLIAPGAFIHDANSKTNTKEKSPSPEPIYDAKGVRINTREYRLREKLQKQRTKVISNIISLDPTYQPPSDYKPPKLTHKIMMPVDDYPDYNFFGLIVGPRGNTQKEMQKETGCKIAVRGQGACLDKPGRLIHPDDNEPLHVHITAPNQESMDKAIKMINDLLEEVKTGGGEHKAKQLRELATINGTLRVESRCRICGGQHPIYRCPEKTGEKWTPADVECKICGELTHVTEDCKYYKKGRSIHEQIIINNNRQSIDAEYRSFMQELIGDGPISSNRPVAAITAPVSVPMPIVIGAQVNINMPQPNAVVSGNGNGKGNGYHNVPPPGQNGALPPKKYNGEEKGDNNNNGQGIGIGVMPQMMGPMGGIPMMYPNPYMGMNPYMRPMYPMPINPYMQRPPIMAPMH